MRRINLKKANVARADTIRYINRQIVLNYVREKEPISRAKISHATALQRSTVSLIVDELKTRGLIYEIEGESTGGRPPTLLRLQARSEEHTSELQSQSNLVCRLLLETARAGRYPLSLHDALPISNRAQLRA